MADPFASLSTGLTGPPRNWAIVTPDDAADLDTIPRGISIAEAGAVGTVDQAGTTVVLPSGVLAVGVIHAMRPKRIRSTGTTVGAGKIVMWW